MEVKTYTIAYLAKFIEEKNKFLKFSIIWENQKLPNSLFEVLKQIAKAVYNDITNPVEGHANVSQWCKNTMCWEQVKKIG